MAEPTSHKPKDYKAIMLSSTFTDLKEHRARAIAELEVNEANADEPIDRVVHHG